MSDCTDLRVPAATQPADSILYLVETNLRTGHREVLHTWPYGASSAADRDAAESYLAVIAAQDKGSEHTYYLTTVGGRA